MGLEVGLGSPDGVVVGEVVAVGEALGETVGLDVALAVGDGDGLAAPTMIVPLPLGPVGRLSEYVIVPAAVMTRWHSDPCAIRLQGWNARGVGLSDVMTALLPCTRTNRIVSPTMAWVVAGVNVVGPVAGTATWMVWVSAARAFCHGMATTAAMTTAMDATMVAVNRERGCLTARNASPSLRVFRTPYVRLRHSWKAD